MSEEDDEPVWRGLRSHLDGLERLAPTPVPIEEIREPRTRGAGQLATAGLTGLVALGVIAIAIAITGLVPQAPAPGSLTSDEARLHQEAQDDLVRWAQAASAPDAVVFTGDLTGQVGEWEVAVGENDKIALYAGRLVAQTVLPTGTPAPGAVRWPDGTSRAVELLSADQALREVISSAASECSGCRPLDVVGARLITTQVKTSRGLATAPVWAFSLAGTAVTVTRVAVAHPVQVAVPSWDPADPPIGISIDAAHGAPDSDQLTVSFVGAPASADQPCGADYTAETVESDLAVVVIIVEHRNPTPASCADVGAQRTAVATLPRALGDRTVLEVTEGLPVPLSPGS